MNINGIILVGPPGSGKSTVGRAVAKQLGMYYISSGDIARELAERDKETRDSLAIGGLANEEKMRQAIYNRLYDLNVSNKEFVLDGFPRFTEQYEWLVKRFPRLLTYVIDVPTDTCIMRMIARKRTDDNDKVIANRMEYYRRNTLPMIFQIGLVRVISNDHSDMSIRDIVADVREKVGI